MSPVESPQRTAALPLFPLNTVLFPGGPLPLRIFEPRYVDMVRTCVRDGVPFGVVMIRSGAEVGPVAETAESGTTARIVDFNTLPDGLLGITCRGERKFRIHKRWQQSDGLNLGDVEYLPAEPSVPLPDEYRHLGALLHKVLAELGELYDGLPADFADAGWVGNRLAEILPLAPPEKVELLELDRPLVRLARLNAIIKVPERGE